MALIKQSGDAELVNLLKGSTAGLGMGGPSIDNPQNLLFITVLIPQQIAVQQLGNSQDLSRVSLHQSFFPNNSLYCIHSFVFNSIELEFASTYSPFSCLHRSLCWLKYSGRLSILHEIE